MWCKVVLLSVCVICNFLCFGFVCYECGGMYEDLVEKMKVVVEVDDMCFFCVEVKVKFGENIGDLL